MTADDGGLTTDEIEQLKQIKDDHQTGRRELNGRAPYSDSPDLQDAVLDVVREPETTSPFKARDIRGRVDTDEEFGVGAVGSLLARLEERGCVERRRDWGGVILWDHTEGDDE